MRLPLAPIALAAAFVLGPVAAGDAPALSQDFSITNPAEPADPGRRDLIRQLQAWWDLHAYYPRHASNNDEGGTVKLHLTIHTDGNIWKIDLAGSSGSASLDAAAASTFRGGYVRPLPPGAPEAELDLSLHYVLAHRHDQPVPAGYTPAVSRGSFTITNEPVRSPILETMLQRTCTGTVVFSGIRNHPMYGVPTWAQAIFFRKPDGTPWVKFYVGGHPILAPVVEVGKIVQWSGRNENPKESDKFTQYTVWPESENSIVGNIDTVFPHGPEMEAGLNHRGTVDLTCETEVVPPVAFNGWFVTPSQSPIGDPP